MSIKFKLRVGVEWVNDFSTDPDCQQVNLPFSSTIAQGFVACMEAAGHKKVFDWGNQNAWATDLEAPPVGDSSDWSDDVHFFYYADHGGLWDNTNFNIAFASDHNTCFSPSGLWRLGHKSLKWCVFDACQVVLSTGASHIVKIWKKSFRGVHLVFGFVGLSYIGAGSASRGAMFGLFSSSGIALSDAWLLANQLADSDNVPIAVAGGETEADAVNRRDNETLNGRDSSISKTRWLAWTWRS